MDAGRHESRASLLFRITMAAAIGVTPSDMECLDFLLEQGSATAGDLARQTNLTSGAITSMIRRLERAGFLTSQRDPRDRRRVVVTPNPDGIRRGTELYASFVTEIITLVESYTTDELTLLAEHSEAMSRIYLARIAALQDMR